MLPKVNVGYQRLVKYSSIAESQEKGKAKISRRRNLYRHSLFVPPRLYKLPSKKHPEFAKLYTKALEILRKDPYNRSKCYPIKKLQDVKRDEGQYRIRLQRFRIRYDIYGIEVLLQYCGLRREDIYE